MHVISKVSYDRQTQISYVSSLVAGVYRKTQPWGNIMYHVVIVGAGFGGLAAAKTLIAFKDSKLKITIIDEKNHHLFQPLLYQVASAALSPAEIAAPIRSILQAGRNAVDVVMGLVTKIDVTTKKITWSGGPDISYDAVILACGASHSYFNHPEWEEFAPGLKTLEQATEIRRRVLEAYEKADATSDDALRRDLLTFVVVGGGPTGVELAGSLGEISRQTLAQDFTRIDPSSTRVVLIEAGKRILPSFSEELSRRAARDLEKIGVTVWTSTRVTEINKDGVRLGGEFVAAKTVLWAAGVRPSPLAKILGGTLDPVGRIEVDEHLLVNPHKDVFAIGDMASFSDKLLGRLPGLAPVAMQQGRHAARNVRALMKGEALKPFKYIDKGQMATIGKRRAVSEFKGIELAGIFAWWAWLVVHIYYLVGFRSKLFVMIEWVSSYVFFKRGARLITRQQWKLGGE